MKLYRIKDQALLHLDGQFYLSPALESWHGLINRNDLHNYLKDRKNDWEVMPDHFLDTEKAVAPPVDPHQEVWAAGVTYLRSKVARMEESEQTGGAVFYNLVYDAERPELFFKSMGYRVRGHHQPIQIRPDSTWDVPEPELTLFITRDQRIVAYTIGNDVSSRSIEGENPLYLPQAKVYDGSAAVGPCLWVPESPIPMNSQIKITITRGDQVLYEDSVEINMMKRKHLELSEFLFRAHSFDKGVFLMTGTCLVPDHTFTLRENDVVTISVDHIGTLINQVKNNIQ